MTTAVAKRDIQQELQSELNQAESLLPGAQIQRCNISHVTWNWWVRERTTATTLRLAIIPELYPLSVMNLHRHEEDSQAWLVDQARLLQNRQFRLLDCDGIAEELEDMSAAEKRQLRTRLRNLLFHLLKWAYQPDNRTSSWRRTINNQRDGIEDLLRYSPSLMTDLRISFLEMYARAVRDAHDIMRPKAPQIPGNCPWSLDMIRDPEFFPESEHQDR